MTDPRGTPLVISFTGALFAVYQRPIAADGLKGALFIMGRDREAIFGWSDPGGGAEHYSSYSIDRPGFTAAYHVVLDAIVAAEAAGRVLWMPNVGSVDRWRRLNEMLDRNGLPQIDGTDPPIPKVEGGPRVREFTPKEVYAAVQEHELPFRVIWTGLELGWA